MHFTAHNDDFIDDHIRADLEIITAQLTNTIPGLVSLILIGGFGRGEGSVVIENNQIQVLNDYDFVLVINDSLPPRKLLKQQSRQLAQELKVRFVDLIPFQLNDLASLPPTQFNFDLKHGGMVIWGQDALSLLPNYKSDNIDVISAQTLLLNRMICLLESYSNRFERVVPVQEERFFLYYQAQKVILAIAEALLIAARCYDLSYQKRVERFSDQFPALESLHSLISEATSYKLQPSTNLWEQADVVRLWNKAVSVLLKAITLSLTGMLDSHAPDQIEQAYLELERNPEPATARSISQYLTYPLETNNVRPNDIEKAELFLLCSLLSGRITKYRYILKAWQIVRRVKPIGVLSLLSWESLRQHVVRTWFEVNH